MEKPKKPGKRAGPNAWDRYHNEMSAWKAQQQRRSFGTGTVGQTSRHTAPVHGTTEDGPVTAAFGTGHREGKTT